MNTSNTYPGSESDEQEELAADMRQDEMISMPWCCRRMMNLQGGQKY